MPVRAYLQGVPTPLLGPPECDMREVDRHKTPSGSTLIEYQGVDGNTYHLFVGENGRTWLVTRR